jgi:hypothetical protein
VLASLAGLISVAAFGQDADNYRCTYGDLTRRVEIVYETGVRVPCEVHYYKDTEAPGDMQVLWRALNEEGYCEARSQEFIAKLEAMGWDCGASAAGSMPEESEPADVDDTDTLAPAEDIELSESEMQR